MGRAHRLTHGQDAAVIALGTPAAAALQAAKRLAQDGIDMTVISARFAKPLDQAMLADVLKEFTGKPVLIVEDHAQIGGFASAVWETAQRLALDVRHCVPLGMPDAYIDYNSREKQLTQIGLTAETIAAKISDLLAKK